MAIVESVEVLEINIPVNVTVNTGTLTKGQVDNKCVPFVTLRSPRNGDERFDARFVKVTISGSTVTVTRDSSTGITSVDVIVSIVEFTDECTVTTGEAVIESGLLTATDTIALTDITRAFVYMTYTPTSPVDDFNDSLTTVEITNTTTLTFTRRATSQQVFCRWYTVECDAIQFDVQRGSFLLDGTLNTAESAAFTAVDLARTMTIGNFNTTEGIDDAETGNCTIDLVDTTHVRARRANGTVPQAGEIDIDFQVIQFAAAENISVQRGEFVIAGNEDTDIITEVNLDGSMAHSPSGQNNASMNSTNGDDIGSLFCSMDIQDSTTVRGRLVSGTAPTGVHSWEVIEWIVVPVGGIVKSVEQILITIGVNDTVNTGTLTKGQIAAKCVPFTTCAAIAENTATLSNRFVRVTISGSTVTATRTVASSIISVDVIIFVVEYTDECTVQTGEATITNTNTSITDSPPINFTDLTKTFVYMTYTPDSTGTNLDDNYTTVEIINTTTLDFSRIGNVDEIICRWYTVECDATQFDVQRGSFGFTGTNFTATSTPFTAVDMARTMVIANFKTNEDITASEEGNCTVDLLTTTTVRARRALGTTPIDGKLLDINFQVIQFAADQNISVQRGEFLITVTADTDTITTVDLNRSMPHAPAGENGGEANSSGVTGIAQCFVKLDFQDDSTVRGQVGSQETNTGFSWEVIEYPLAAPEEVRVFSTAITNPSAII